MFVVSETDLGTPERRWRRATAVVDAPEMDWGAPGRVVALAPHPDDETLAVGGTLSILARRGFAVEVVAITDGEGSHPRSPTTSPAMLARRRVEEQTAALAELRVTQIHRLGIPDGAVAGSDLAARLRALVDGAAFVLAPFARDGHPDHEATGAAAEAVHPRVLSYPVWMWHWARPLDPSLPWARFRRVSLDDDAGAAKARAIACFESQLHPLSLQPGDERVLPPAVLERFRRPFETVIVP